MTQITEIIKHEIGRFCCSIKYHPLKITCEKCGKQIASRASDQLRQYMDTYMMKQELWMEHSDLFQEISENVRNFLTICMIQAIMREIIPYVPNAMDPSQKKDALEIITRFLATPALNPVTDLVEKYLEAYTTHDEKDESSQELSQNMGSELHSELNEILIDLQSLFSDFDKIKLLLEEDPHTNGEDSMQEFAKNLEIMALKETLYNIQHELEGKLV